jgi:hypothetical protein
VVKNQQEPPAAGRSFNRGELLAIIAIPAKARGAFSGGSAGAGGPIMG